ncbi:MAG TPA: hypothetical protein PK490_18550, partial [Prosthecobacter sp.]|nr:hypothetical protein [Prosthecobacter sp.]
MSTRLLYCVPFLFATTGLRAAVDYMTQVKPLLQAQCVKCHGASTQKGGLKLDTAAGALRGGG